MQTAQQVYLNEVTVLPPSEQLRLASLILEGLTASAASTVDVCDHWSEDDMREVAEYSAKHAAESLDKE